MPQASSATSVSMAAIVVDCPASPDLVRWYEP